MPHFLKKKKKEKKKKEIFCRKVWMEYFFSAKTNFSLNFKEVKPILQTPKTEGGKEEILQQKLGLRGETTLAKAWATKF